MFSTKAELEDRFHASGRVGDEIPQRYNAAPSECLPMIVPKYGDGPPENVIRLAQWGFLPRWAAGSKAPAIINARAETIVDKPYFRSAIRKRRCLIPANSFFEWDRLSSPAQPWRILLNGDEPFSLAGVWEPAPEASGRPTFAIITTTANRLVGQVHDRMPVILEQGMEDVWLHPSLAIEAVQGMLRPYPAEHMRMYRVSPRVNSARVDDAALLEEAA